MWWTRVMLGTLALVAAAFVLDEAIWVLRGSPQQNVSVEVLTVIELKGNKEDYGTAETQVVRCQNSLLPFPGAVPPCWWVARHHEVVRRF